MSPTLQTLLIGGFGVVTVGLLLARATVHRRLSAAAAALADGASRHETSLRTMAALRASEGRLDFALQTSELGAWQLDPADLAMQRTPLYDRIFGYDPPPARWTYEMFLDHVLPEDRPEVDRSFRAASAARGPWNIACRIRRADGQVRWLWVVGSHEQCPDGEPWRMSGVVKDITERKAADAAFRESGERFRELVASVDGIVWEANATDGRFTFASAPAERLLGYPLAEWLAQPAFWRAHLHPDDREAAVTQREIATRELRAHDAEYRMVKADGQAIWLHDVVTVVSEGHVPSMLRGVMTDITAHKVADAERARLDLQLAQVEKMREIGTLAGGVAHDFNNILGAILNNVALIEEEIGSGSPARESLDQIRKSGERAVGLVKQILAFSRRDAPVTRRVSLRAEVDESLRLLRATIPAGVQLVTRFGDDTPDVDGNAIEIHQVLLNLCTNAWHAMEGDRGCITVALGGMSARAGLASPGLAGLRPGRYARLSVTDTGAGMEAATCARIFEPFFTTKKEGHGTGLGLAVVHRIVTAWEGAITVASQPGQGTTFEVYLPAAAAPERQVVPAVVVAPAAAAMPPGGGRILFVDDDAAMVFVGKRILERRGYQVTTCTDGAGAVAALITDPDAFDVVVTDYHMPVASGVEVARDMRVHRPDLRLILASGNLSDAIKAEASAAGIEHLLDKPYSPEALVGAIHRVLHAEGERHILAACRTA